MSLLALGKRATIRSQEEGPRAELCSPNPIQCLYGLQGRGRGSQSVIDTPASESPHEELGIGARGRWDIRMDVDQWIVDVDAVDGQVQCPAYTYFRRRTTGGRASDPPAHRASHSRHPLVPARTVQCILKYRTDLRSPLSAPRRLERDTVLRSRKKGGEGRPHTAYSISQILHTAWRDPR